MRILSLPLDQLSIPPARQRQEFDPEKIVALATSIAERGLIHPVVVMKVDNGYALVAGERRLRALDYLWNMGESVRVAQTVFPEHHIPCIDQGELTPIEAMEIELAENIDRQDLTWQERCQAHARVVELRKQIEKDKGMVEPPLVEIAVEILPEHSAGAAQLIVREEVILARHLNDPDVAKAPTRSEAFKILKRKELTQRNADLAHRVGTTFNSFVHQLYNQNCIEWMEAAEPAQFDVLLTDPPYGIDAQDFNDSGGKAVGSHFYDDSYATWLNLQERLAHYSFSLCKPLAHAYVFCDIDNFGQLKLTFSMAGWNVFRTPLIFINPTANRAPWPDKGPMRKWQAILYAVKGNKPCTSLKWDVLNYSSDDNLSHHAQKPVALFTDLLSRSCRPGDSVFDPFCGSGPVFPAAHSLKVRATGIERDAAAYGIAVNRLRELK